MDISELKQGQLMAVVSVNVEGLTSPCAQTDNSVPDFNFHNVGDTVQIIRIM